MQTQYTHKEAQLTNKRQVVNRDAKGRIRSLRDPFGVYHGTREQWLNEASNIMSVWINDMISSGSNSDDDKTRSRYEKMTKYQPHQVEFACSLLSGGMRIDGELGHCHKMGSSYEIRLGVHVTGEDDIKSARVADILLHEMLHVVTWGDGHKSVFRQIATDIGLTGKMTSTRAGEDLFDRILTEIVYVLGKYPHKIEGLETEHKADGGIIITTPDGRPVLPRGSRGKGSRMLKVTCFECGMNFRTSRKWIAVADGDFVCPIPTCGGQCVIE